MAPRPDIRGSLSAGGQGPTIPPVVLLWGDDVKAVAEATQRWRSIIAAHDAALAGLEAFNVERFDAAYCPSIGLVERACLTAPIGTTLRVVEVANPELFATQVSASGAEQTAAAFLDALCVYAAQPVSTTVLLLTSVGLRANARLVKAVTAHGHSERCTALDERTSHGYVGALAQTLGIEIDARAVAALIEAVGADRARLSAALERSLAHAGGARVSLADVRAVVVDEREADVFALVEAIGAGEASDALQRLAHLFALGERDHGTALRLLALLTRQFRLLATAAQVGEDAAALGVPPFAARKLAAQARRLDEARLARSLRALARIDSELKGVGRGASLAQHAPMVVLQRWILEACGRMNGCEPA